MLREHFREDSCKIVGTFYGFTALFSEMFVVAINLEKHSLFSFDNRSNQMTCDSSKIVKQAILFTISIHPTISVKKDKM